MCTEYIVLCISRQRKALLEETHQERDKATAAHTDSAVLQVSVKSDQHCHLSIHTYSAANTADLLDSTVVRQCTHGHWKHRGCTLFEGRMVLPVPFPTAAELLHQPTNPPLKSSEKSDYRIIINSKAQLFIFLG